MDDGVQLYFCEFCNQSVPQKDLDSGAARRINDRVAGACCLPQLLPKARAAVEPGSLLAVAGVCLIAIAGSAFYLDWRLGMGLERQGRQVGTTVTELQGLGDRLRGVEARFEDVARKADLGELTTQLAQGAEPLRSMVRALDEKLQNHVVDGQRTAAETRVLADQATQRGTQVERALAQLSATLAGIQTEIKELRAGAVAGGGSQPATPAAPPEKPAAENASGPQSPPAELPKNLQHYVQQLADPDAGTRWNAVDALAKSGDARVVPHLILVLKDADAFVRRFCAGSLGELKARDAVPPLIDALADRELIVREAAQRSLKKITGQAIEFEADGPANKRADAIQKWRDWWQGQGGK